ncbi:MAG: leucyl aminopeptidase family protein [Leptospiraceae bacterium]|nr:leucyl aminopeptidase family protein [Leptospiraceae bacterium]MCP5497320.1 leucyl aminopeptidase family protein [Leptospiraceae bacterium]
MKLEPSKLNISIGKNKSNNLYNIYHVFKNDIPPNLKGELEPFATSKIFIGDMGQQHIDHKGRIIYLGLGEKEKITLRKIAGIYIKMGEQLVKWENVGLNINVSQELTDLFSSRLIVYHLSTSLEVGAFAVNSLSKAYREKTIKVGMITFSLENKKEEQKAKEGQLKSKIVSPYVNGARYVEHLPANHFTPDGFVERAKAIAQENKLTITVFDESRLKKEKLNGILSVCQGSEQKPKMIIMEYKPVGANSQNKLAIVGKGLTFDAGGISLKPSAEMHEMKYDMCGAAAVIHAMGAIASLNLNIHVIAAIGVAENMPDGKAIKPGDVYTAYNGLTVEVQNTDAEGRLVLGDVLSYISKKYKPKYMIDLATLTGAVIVALGNEAAGVLCNSRELFATIQKASASSEDRVWELPMWEEYGEDLKSDIADIRNITSGRLAGTIAGAQFLSKFVEKDVQWGHIDIAGTAWRSKPSGTQCQGPTGYGVRLLVDVAEELSAS